MKNKCSIFYCENPTSGQFCKEHEGFKSTTQRLSSHQRGYNWKWRKAAKRFLSENPLCVVCDRKGKVEKAVVVDHILPHNGTQSLFWRRSNWQALCKYHHDQKTGYESSGFAQRKKQKRVEKVNGNRSPKVGG